MDLIALIGPVAVIFGVGAFLVIMPIVRLGGDRYQHEEYQARGVSSNGHGLGPGSRAGKSARSAALDSHLHEEDVAQQPP